MFKIKYLALVFITVLTIACGGGGGGGGSSDPIDESVIEIPIDFSLQNVSLPAGSPVGIIYTIPKPSKPYTNVTIDLDKTLESAHISVVAIP
jgi:hypothetical protein